MLPSAHATVESQSWDIKMSSDSAPWPSLCLQGDPPVSVFSSVTEALPRAGTALGSRGSARHPWGPARLATTRPLGSELKAERRDKREGRGTVRQLGPFVGSSRPPSPREQGRGKFSMGWEVGSRSFQFGQGVCRLLLPLLCSSSAGKARGPAWVRADSAGLRSRVNLVAVAVHGLAARWEPLRGSVCAGTR